MSIIWRDTPMQKAKIVIPKNKQLSKKKKKNPQ